MDGHCQCDFAGRSEKDVMSFFFFQWISQTGDPSHVIATHKRTIQCLMYPLSMVLTPGFSNSPCPFNLSFSNSGYFAFLTPAQVLDFTLP